MPTATPSEVAADDDVLTAAAALGPLPLLPRLDAGALLGLPSSTLILDGARVAIPQAVANHYARNGQWDAFPTGPADDVAPDGTFDALARRLGLDAATRARVALVDDGLLGDQDGVLAALEAQEDLERLARRISDIAASSPGGQQAFFDLLDKEARGEELTATERQRLDSRLTSGLRQDLQGPMSLAHLLWPALAEQASSTPSNPWAGLVGATAIPAVDAAVMATQARQASDPVALLSQVYGVTPRPVPTVGFIEAVHRLAFAHHQPLTADDELALEGYAAGLAPDEAQALARTILAAALAQEASEAAYAAIPADLWQAAEQILRPQSSASSAAPDPKELLRQLLTAVDGRGLVQDLAQASSDFLGTVGGLQDAFADSPSASVTGGQLGLSPVLVIGSAGDDLITDPAFILIEPSGNDHHQASADALELPCPLICLGAGGSISAVVDIEGDDTYEPTSSTPYCGSLGGAYFGASLLSDLNGNDVYSNGPCAMSMGGGFEGLGVFFDASGDDTYVATSKSLYPQPTMLGGGYLGAGLFLDASGNDRYRVEAPQIAMVLGGAYEGGLGVFIERGGDDAYESVGKSPAFGGGLYPSAVARFTDVEGDDSYSARGPSFGYGPGAVATFLDADGADEYEAGTYVPSQCVGTAGVCGAVGNDRAWVGKAAALVPGCLVICLGPSLPSIGLASSGADVDLGVPGPANLQARIVAPRSGSAIATAEAVVIGVSAINTGSAAVSAATGVLTFTTTTDDESPGELVGSFTIDFGTVQAGERSDRTVVWETPATERYVQIRLTIAGAGDAEPADNVATSSVVVDNVNAVSVNDLFVTSTGKVRPGMAMAPSVVLSNLGNVPYDALPVTLTITKVGASPETTLTQTVALDRPGPFYDPGNSPVVLPVGFSTTAPSVEGDYILKVAIPTSANDLDPAKAEQQISMKVQVIRDLAVLPVSPSYLSDPSFFVQDGGYGVVVRNVGTVPISGATLTLGTRCASGCGPGATTAQLPAQAVPDLEADESQVFQAPALTYLPEPGAAWVFTAALTVAQDAVNANNVMSRAVLFERDIALAFDFEADDETQLPGDSRWVRGTPQTPSPSPLAGPQAWSTGLYDNFPQGSQTPRNHDLVLSNIDLSDYLDPRLQFQHSTHGNYGSVISNSGLVYSLAVSPAGQDHFERVTPDGGYPCLNNVNGQADSGPGYCLTMDWQVATFDLAQYSGTPVDLRFRVSTPSYLGAAARGWTIDDVRVYGVRRLPLDLQVVDVDIPEPVLAGIATPIVLHVRNNGFTTLGDVDAALLVSKGTSGAAQTLRATCIETPSTLPPCTDLHPLEVRDFAVTWVPATASLYSFQTRATSGAADPNPVNNVLAGKATVYDLVRRLDAETQVASDWTFAASVSPQDWALGPPGPAEIPREAPTGTKVWATNLNGAYQKTDENAGRYSYFETLYAPPTVISGHIPGDEYLLAFTHQHTLTSYFGSYSDIAYVTAKVNTAERLLEPEGGYPGKSQFGAPFTPRPPNNGEVRGYLGANEQYERALLPLPSLQDGDVVRPGFTLYANYCYGCDRESGWTVDDILVLRAPRFDRDVDVQVIGPKLIDLGQPDALSIKVENLGRQATDAFAVHASLTTLDPEHPLTIDGAVLPLAPGESRVVKLPFVAPLEVGERVVTVEADWPADEWDLNNVHADVVRLARVLYRADFEEGSGGFQVANGQRFTVGPRPDGPNIQGTSSWFTGPFDTACCSPQAEALAFPPLDLDTGVRYPSVQLIGQIGFDVYPCNDFYSMANFRLTDTITQESFEMTPARLIDLYPSYAPTGEGHCIQNGIGDPFPFVTDLTHRQGADSKLQLVWDGRTSYYGSGGNTGMELDDVAIFALPYGENAGLTGFLSPPGGLVGPGEEVPVTVEVVGAGLSWPTQAVGVHIFSNDVLGAGGAPSLDQVIPIAPLAFNERFQASVPWRPAEALDGQSLVLAAELVTMGTGTPLGDEQGGDNLVTMPISVLSVHHLAVKLVADPNVDPDQVRPVNVAAQVLNLGTRTENNVRVGLTYTDITTGAVLRRTDFPALQKRPDAAQAAATLGETWTPPGPGHYGIEAVLQYANEAQDADPTAHTALTQVHAAGLPQRFGSAFDDVDATGGWTALGGQLAKGGFRQVPDPTAPEGAGILATGTYEDNARYSYSIVTDLPTGSPAALVWTQRLDLGPGDQALVQGSRDNGGSWTTLASPTGSAAWSTQSVDLATLRGGTTLLRFVLEADGSGAGTGWDLDDVQVLVGGAPVRSLGFEDPYGEVLRSWDFEVASDEGWLHSGDAPAGSASGIDDWAHGTPTATAHVTPVSGSGLWKTNLDGDYTMPCYSSACPTPDNTFGARRLTSPAFTVPAGRDQVSFTWWQWLEVYPGAIACPFSCFGTPADLASVYVVVDGQSHPVTPVTGYGTTGPESRAVGGRGWSGSSDGWQHQAIDLTPYAGKSVQVVYQLATPSAATDYYRNSAYYEMMPIPGTLGGFAIDDVRLQATPSVAIANTAVAGVTLGAQPLAGRDLPATVRLTRSGTTTPVTLDFTWTGANGETLPAPAQQVVTVSTEGALVPIVLPAVTSQHSLLRIVATSDPDQQSVDDVLEVPVTVEDLIYGTTFGTASDTACGKTTPCMSWTHAVLSGSDEWEHGSIPASKFSAAPSSPYAFATDISGGTYEVSTKSRLTTPLLNIPAGGTVLRFKHTLETNAYASYYYDGGRVMATGAVLQPEDGYTLGDCGYYSDYKPCWHGTFDWRSETIPLESLAGRSVKLDFVFAAGPADSPVPDQPASGWAIDDVTVSKPPPTPADDLVLSAPPLVKIDAQDPRPLAIVVRNLGTAASQPSRLEATFYRDGQPLPATTIGFPGLPTGSDSAIAVPLPAGPLTGLQVALRLVDGAGQPWQDGDPSNDVARARILPAYTAAGLIPTAGTAPLVADRQAAPFTVRAPPEEPGAPDLAFVAGFGEPLATEQALLLPAVAVPPGAELDFTQRVRMTGVHDGAFIEASTDGGRTWSQLDPLGGYPTLARYAGDNPCVSEGHRTSSGYYVSSVVGRCFSGDRPWSTVRVPLDGLAGKTAWLRLTYISNGQMDEQHGWAIGDVHIRADGQAENLLHTPRWAAGSILNPLGPLEEASQPNAWGTGLTRDAARDPSYDILQSPPIASGLMLRPTVGFDWFGAPEDGGSLLVQVRAPSSDWRTVGSLAGKTAVWKHAQFDLGEVGDWTQVRLVYTLPDLAKAPRAAPGFFVDNVLVGSLRGAVDVLVPDLEDGEPLPVHEATTVTLPVLLSNPGDFTNRYQLEVRGLDPTWIGHGGPAITLGPGQSVLTSVQVDIPYLRESGIVPVLVLARSAFDPLQAATDELPLDVTVAPKPDYVVKSIGFQSSFLVEGDPLRHVEDARPNTLIAEIENVGLTAGNQPLEVLFLEHHANGDVFPIDVAFVPIMNLTAPDDPQHAAYGAFVEWFPRKGVSAVEVIANPEAQGNRFPSNPESDFGNNVQFAAVVVEPRPLPELVYAAQPAFSRQPQVGLPVSLGVDVRNGGNAPSLTPVDVALMASPQDAYLTSPPFNLPSNSLMRLVYSSDLELRSDGFVVEFLDADGSWSTVSPTGGYPNGCLLGLACQSGVSGRADHRLLTFNLAGREGPTQVRLRFAMDSHNGRTYDGLQVHDVSVQQFLTTVQRFDFSSSMAGWSAAPTYTAKDGSPATVFQYRAREGPIPGTWSIPTNYANPALVALRSVKPIATGGLEHTDLEWTPRFGGDTDLRLLIDPKNGEPEYVDDLNGRDFSQRVAVSGFELRATAPPCGTAAFCLPDAQASGNFPVRLVNTGNTRSHFEVKPQAHPFLDTTLRVGDRALTGIELEAGQAVDGVLSVQAHSAPAGTHTLQFDVLDNSVGKTTRIALTLRVQSATLTPLKVIGLEPFAVVASDRQTVTLENPGNQVVPVLLRAGDKPAGLAMRVSPNEFTLAPFESRSIEIELLNLGVAAKTYTLGLVNARAACTATQADCGLVTKLTAVVSEYAPPVADWSVAGPVRPNAPSTFLDASKSKGSTIAAWHWDFGDGTTSNLAQPPHTYAKPGVYTVILGVTDALGGTSQSVPRTVTVANDAPRAVATRSVQTPTVGVPVNFSATDSLDLDGGIAKVTWAFGDGTLVTGLDVAHTYREPGTYRVVVAVEDAFGAVDVYEMEVHVDGATALDLAKDTQSKQESPLPAWTALLAVGLLALVRRRRA